MSQNSKRGLKYFGRLHYFVKDFTAVGFWAFLN